MTRLHSSFGLAWLLFGLIVLALIVNPVTSAAGGFLPTMTPQGGSEAPAERIVFIANEDGDFITPDGGFDLYDGGWEVYTIRLDGSDFAQLTGSDYDADDPSLSPDGTRIVYKVWGENYTTAVMVMDVDGSHQRALTGFETQKGRPYWSPDGSQIAFVDWGETDQVVVINADGTDRRVLAQPDMMSSWLAWSPDGTHIAFTAQVGGADQADLYVIDVDGTDLRILSDHESYEADPHWSADGTSITFARYGEDPTYYRLILADGTVEPLSFVSRGGGAWSPDESQVVTLFWQDDEQHLMVNAADGSESRTVLTTTERPPIYARWSADGSQIYYFQQVGESYLYNDLFVIDAAGGEPRRLTYTNTAAIGFEQFP